jgi:hypothetical protein
LSGDSARRDTPAQIAPDNSANRPVQAPVRHLGDEAGKSSLAELQAPAATSPSENTPAEPALKTELKDERLKAGQPPTVEELSLLEKSRLVISSDKAKEPVAPETAAPARESYAEKEQALLRQRYALAPAQAGGATGATNALANAPKVPATSTTQAAAAPQVALDGANFGQRAGSVGGRGFAAGTASNPASGPNLAFNRPQNGAKADGSSLAFTRSSGVPTGNVESLAATREIDRLGTSRVYFAAIPPSPGSQRFARVLEYRRNLNSPPMPNVLNSFQLVQNGRQIRVVDSDDSIYDGAIEQPEEAARREIAVLTTATDLKKNIEPKTKRIEGVVAATTGEAPAAQNLFFRVSGTNRTLNQLVLFEGKLLTQTNQTNDIRVDAKSAADQSTAVGRQSLSQKAQQAPGTVIRGQATIGSSNRIEINAAPVSE